MRRDYYPFGESVTASGDEESLYQFTGKEKDSNTGLIYFGARYYDPGIGRFMSVDPLAGKYWEWSPYHYSFNNPLGFIDPDGNYIISSRTANENPVLIAAALAAERFASTSGTLQNIFKNQIHSSVDSFIGFGIVKEGKTVKGNGRGPEIIVSKQWDKTRSTAGKFPRDDFHGYGKIKIANWILEKYYYGNRDEQKAAFTLMWMVILHETAHWADYHNDSDYQVDADDHHKFNREVFGIKGSKSNQYNSYWEYWYDYEWPNYNNNDNQNKKSTNENTIPDWDEYDPSNQ
ncbi:hypothetical protein GF354_03455 [Candidatus Peregrinibacteria bacterium]|nr:hypothetical protein [Candidatus Peregrinibacteria bacterium]